MSPNRSVSSGGTIDQSGLFTAGGTAGGSFTVTAAQSSVSGTAQVTVVGQLIVSIESVASGKAYQVVDQGLASGALVYIDRSYTYASVPPALEGATYLRTANDDKYDSNAAFLSFSVNQDVKVYVGYDVRASALPNWLNAWSATGQIAVTTDVNHNLFSRDFGAGSITLGGNLAPGAAGAHSNYSVIIVPR